jgi:hypothetical protein
MRFGWDNRAAIFVSVDMPDAVRHSAEIVAREVSLGRDACG